MKKLIIILILGICFTQTYEDVVILKNGSEIHGIIIEQKPNEYIKIQSGKNIFVYQMDEINLIKKELIDEEISNINRTYISFGGGLATKKLWNFGQASVDIGLTNNISLYIAAGYPTLIGGGLSILQNRNGNGLIFSAGIGFEPEWEALDILGSFGYQFRVGQSPAFFTIGVSAGIWDVDWYNEFLILPIIDLDFRF